MLTTDLRAVRWRCRVANKALEEISEPRVLHGAGGGISFDHQRDTELGHQTLDVCERHIAQGSPHSLGRVVASERFRELSRGGISVVRTGNEREVLAVRGLVDFIRW